MKLSEFLVEIRKAVNSAANALTERNIEFFNKYFEEKRISETETVRVPKTVRMDYPMAADDGSIKMKRLDVPVISLIPVSGSRLGKAIFSMDCQIDEEHGDVTVSFPKKVFGNAKNNCHLEFTVVPDEAPEGISTIIENYNTLIQKQLEE